MKVSPHALGWDPSPCLECAWISPGPPFQSWGWGGACDFEDCEFSCCFLRCLLFGFLLETGLVAFSRHPFQ